MPQSYCKLIYHIVYSLVVTDPSAGPFGGLRMWSPADPGLAALALGYNPPPLRG